MRIFIILFFFFFLPNYCSFITKVCFFHPITSIYYTRDSQTYSRICNTKEILALLKNLFVNGCINSNLIVEIPSQSNIGTQFFHLSTFTNTEHFLFNSSRITKKILKYLIFLEEFQCSIFIFTIVLAGHKWTFFCYPSLQV